MPKTVKLGAKQLRSLIINEAKKLNEQAEMYEDDSMTQSRTMKCPDCGKRGERPGHQDCPYPQDHNDMDEGDEQDQDDDDLDEASGEAYGVTGVHEFAASCVDALKKFSDLENVELPTRTTQLFRDVATDFYLKNVKPVGA